MTSTRKGERRRHALVAAAAALLREGGLEAVRHRAVAVRAGVPLAATTYYFASLDELVTSAAEFAAAEAAQAIEKHVAAVARRSRSAETLTDLLVEVLVGESGAGGTLALHYEQHSAVTRHPELRDIQLRMRMNLRHAISEVLERSGRTADAANVRAIDALIAGAVLDAVLDEPPDASAAVRAVLGMVIDQLAPPV